MVELLLLFSVAIWACFALMYSSMLSGPFESDADVAVAVVDAEQVLDSPELVQPVEAEVVVSRAAAEVRVARPRVVRVVRRVERCIFTSRFGVYEGARGTGKLGS